MRCVKIGLKFSSVCEKMSENRRPRGGGGGGDFLTHTVACTMYGPSDH